MKTSLTILFLTLFSFNACAEFTIYDAMLHKGKPDLSILKIKPMPIIYESALLTTKSLSEMPNIKNISKASTIINSSAFDKAIVDIERWPVTGRDNNVKQSLSKYKKVVVDLKSNGVNKAIGYYGVLPVPDYWRAVSKPGSSKFISWQSDNNRLQSLIENVDALFPSLYTFYNDQDGWVKFARAQIGEARRLANGKPVIVFLWPKFHDSNRFLKNKYVPTDFWRVELETALELADGVVIWGGWKENWDSNADWWVETRNFIIDNNLLNN
jgi:hypothetical protein